MKRSEKLIAVLAMAQMFGWVEMSNMFKVDDDPVVLDWHEIEIEYELIQQKKSALSRKDRDQVVYLWEKRVSENRKMENFE